MRQIPTTEHEQKFETLAQKLGIDALKALVPATPEEIRAALAAGDEHLNKIPLVRWDRAALGSAGQPKAGEVCKCCKQRLPVQNSIFSHEWPLNALRATQRLEPWKAAPTLSLAERVCVLKHVATYHLA